MAIIESHRTGQNMHDPSDLLHQPMWYAGYTCARHEKKVSEQLSQRSIEHFLPLYETVHRWKNGRHRVQLPLFPSYIFLRIPLAEKLRALQIPGFVSFVGFGGVPFPLEEAEVTRMQEALNSGVMAKPHPYLKVGSRVEIVSGPLEGMRGILLREQGQCRVVLSIDLIMRSIVVEVDASEVVPLKAEPTAPSQATFTRSDPRPVVSLH
jgi:transcription antitermination factor NusG